jgi:fructose-bisphosphate aldolase class II
VKATGAVSLAIAIGTSHGASKFPKGAVPQIRLDILHQIEAKLPRFLIVLHGSSSNPHDYADMVNVYGGSMPDAVEIPEEQLHEAARNAMYKCNVDSDGRLS